MPSRRAASMTSVPGGTLSSRSSSLNFISAVSAMCFEITLAGRGQRFGRLIRTLAREMLLEFVRATS